jgi:hypothetical protein
LGTPRGCSVSPEVVSSRVEPVGRSSGMASARGSSAVAKSGREAARSSSTSSTPRQNQLLCGDLAMPLLPTHQSRAAAVADEERDVGSCPEERRDREREGRGRLALPHCFPSPTPPDMLRRRNSRHRPSQGRRPSTQGHMTRGAVGTGQGTIAGQARRPTSQM